LSVAVEHNFVIVLHCITGPWEREIERETETEGKRRGEREREKQCGNRKLATGNSMPPSVAATVSIVVATI